MGFSPMTPAEAALALRSLKAVATLEGQTPLTGHQLAALAAFQRHITQTDYDLGELPPITPEELAEALPDPEVRRLAVHDLCFMALADPDVVGEERLELARRFAGALAVEPSIVTATAHAARSQRIRLQLDALRMMLPQEARWTEKMKRLWDMLKPFLGVTDAAVAGRYRALGESSPGSLGRAYFDFITSRRLSFPGEKGGAPEAFFVPHDLVHVLTGYDTDLTGEIQIIGYQAGYSRSPNPLEVILLALVQAQLGLVLDPVAPAARGQLDFDRLLAAFRRGTRATVDFTGGAWDWWAEFPRPVDEVRARCSVVPA